MRMKTRKARFQTTKGKESNFEEIKFWVEQNMIINFVLSCAKKVLENTTALSWCCILYKKLLCSIKTDNSIDRFYIAQ